MANRVYCTYFDHNYLSRGLALYHSLLRHAPGARLWVLCLSEECHRILTTLELPHIVPVRLSDFEKTDPEVAATRAGRSEIEYYFTCSPAWMLFVRERETGAEWVTYLDGDLFFFESPEAIYRELEASAVAIIPHRYPPSFQDCGSSAPTMWDGWEPVTIPTVSPSGGGGSGASNGVMTTSTRGASPIRATSIPFRACPHGSRSSRMSAPTAPLEYRQLPDRRPRRPGDDRCRSSLIFFHFRGLRKGLRWFIFNSHRAFRAPFSAAVRHHIYKPYVDELLAIEQALAPGQQAPVAAPHRRSAVTNIRQYLKSKLRNLAVRLFQLLDIVTGRAFLVLRRRAY